MTVFHGCDDASATAILAGVTLSAGKPLVDFGQGFYTTTYLHQAKNWATMRCSRLGKGRATVVQFEVDRDVLAALHALCFVTDGNNPPFTDFWDFVTYCRNGSTPHRPASGRNYDVVFGPVSLWPQTLVIANCDQISFHTTRALNALGIGRIAAQATGRTF